MLTDIQVRKLKARPTAYRVFDKGSDPGFFVKVNPSGKKHFYLLYRFDGKERFFKLGTYREKTGTLTDREKAGALAEARDACRTARTLLDRNIDPQVARTEELEAVRREREERERAEAIASRLGTVEALFDKYIERLRAEGKRSANQVDRIWKADIKPAIGAMKAKDVRPVDVKRVLHPIIERGAPVLANRCRSYLMAAFRFGIEWDNDPRNYDTTTLFQIEVNPARDVPKPLKEEKPGERTLSAGEIRECWRTWQDPAFLSLPAGCALRLILATGGQRVEEVLRASWSEFNEADGLWEIPAARTKSGRPHVVPLIPLVLEVLEDLRPLIGGDSLLFPLRRPKDAADSDPTEPMQTNSLGNAVRKYCARVQAARTKELREQGLLADDAEADFEPFTARDLRRTVKTLMGKMGIAKDLRDRLQNHALTDVSSKHYDRYDYLREKRIVMAAWEDYLRAMLEGEQSPPNVVKLAR